MTLSSTQSPKLLAVPWETMINTPYPSPSNSSPSPCSIHFTCWTPASLPPLGLTRALLISRLDPSRALHWISLCHHSSCLSSSSIRFSVIFHDNRMWSSYFPAKTFRSLPHCFEVAMWRLFNSPGETLWAKIVAAEMESWRRGSQRASGVRRIP